MHTHSLIRRCRVTPPSCDKERDEQIELCISRLQSEADDSSAAAAAAVREELGSEIAALRTKLSQCEAALREAEGARAKAEAQACESGRTLAVMERELQEKRDSIRYVMPEFCLIAVGSNPRTDRVPHEQQRKQNEEGGWILT